MRPELRPPQLDLEDFLSAQDQVWTPTVADQDVLRRLTEVLRGPAESSVSALTAQAGLSQSAHPLELVLEVAEPGMQADADGWLLPEGGSVVYLTVSEDWESQVSRLADPVVDGQLVLGVNRGHPGGWLSLHVMLLEPDVGSGELTFVARTITWAHPAVAGL